jgi:hypothetical protein
MAVTAYVQPEFIRAALGLKGVNLTTDTLTVGLISNAGLSARGTNDGYRYVSDLLANSGSALTEVVGGGYSRQSLSGLSWTTTNLVVTFTAANPSWAAASFTAYYGWLHDETDSAGTDASRPLYLIWDLGGAQTVTAATFTLAVNASGLVTYTMAV